LLTNCRKRKVPHPYSHPKRATTARSGAPVLARWSAHSRQMRARMGPTSTRSLTGFGMTSV